MILGSKKIVRQQRKELQEFLDEEPWLYNHKFVQVQPVYHLGDLQLAELPTDSEEELDINLNTEEIYPCEEPTYNCKGYIRHPDHRLIYTAFYYKHGCLIH